jgi:hypothetical protein
MVAGRRTLFLSLPGASLTALAGARAWAADITPPDPLPGREGLIAVAACGAAVAVAAGVVLLARRRSAPRLRVVVIVSAVATVVLITLLVAVPRREGGHAINYRERVPITTVAAPDGSVPPSR